MVVEVSEIVTLKELSEFIVPLAPEELSRLESNLIAEGCREPLAVWKRKGELVLIDGHNRLRLCRKHNIPFKIKKLEFKTIEAAKLWIQRA